MFVKMVGVEADRAALLKWCEQVREELLPDIEGWESRKAAFLVLNPWKNPEKMPHPLIQPLVVPGRESSALWIRMRPASAAWSIGRIIGSWLPDESARKTAVAYFKAILSRMAANIGPDRPLPFNVERLAHEAAFLVLAFRSAGIVHIPPDILPPIVVQEVRTLFHPKRIELESLFWDQIGLPVANPRASINVDYANLPAATNEYMRFITEKVYGEMWALNEIVCITKSASPLDVYAAGFSAPAGLLDSVIQEQILLTHKKFLGETVSPDDYRQWCQNYFRPVLWREIVSVMTDFSDGGILKRHNPRVEWAGYLYELTGAGNRLREQLLGRPLTGHMMNIVLGGPMDQESLDAETRLRVITYIRVLVERAAANQLQQQV